MFLKNSYSETCFNFCATLLFFFIWICPLEVNRKHALIFLGILYLRQSAPTVEPSCRILCQLQLTLFRAASLKIELSKESSISISITHCDNIFAIFHHQCCCCFRCCCCCQYNQQQHHHCFHRVQFLSVLATFGILGGRKLNHKVQTFWAIKDTNVSQIKETNVSMQRLAKLQTQYFTSSKWSSGVPI